MRGGEGSTAMNAGKLRRFALLLVACNLLLLTLLFSAEYLALQASKSADISSTADAAQNLAAALSADIAS